MSNGRSDGDNLLHKNRTEPSEYLKQGTVHYTKLGPGTVQGIAQETGAKFDSGKPDYSLLPLDLLRGTVEVFDFGAKKYSRDNFRYPGIGTYRAFAALMRHLEQIQSALREQDKDGSKGFLLDLETGKNHIHHAVCEALILIAQLKNEGFVV